MDTREESLVVYVDVDDTLIRSVGTKRILIPSAIQHVRDLAEQGADLFCWSSGGAAYARASAEEVGIASCFSAFLPNGEYENKMKVLLLCLVNNREQYLS
jgi:predicted HAD superfamily phosphohydrolase YqeG